MPYGRQPSCAQFVVQFRAAQRGAELLASRVVVRNQLAQRALAFRGVDVARLPQLIEQHGCGLLVPLRAVQAAEQIRNGGLHSAWNPQHFVDIG